MSHDTPVTANVLIDCGGMTSAAEVVISGCTIQHTSNAPDSANIRFLGGHPKGRLGHLLIANNLLTDVQINVDIQKARGVSIVGNSFGKAHQYDLRIVDSRSVVIGPNVLDRNPVYKTAEESANGGVLLKSCQDMTITGLHVAEVRHFPAGLVLEDCQRVNLTGCTILDCDGAGILLKRVSNSRISNCLIRNDQSPDQPWTPIKAEASAGNVIAKELLVGS